jgi:hypothetical protein
VSKILAVSLRQKNNSSENTKHFFHTINKEVFFISSFGFVISNQLVGLINRD